MKKKLILGLACLGLTLTLSACGTAVKKDEAANYRPNRRPDFGQPSSQPEIRGLVKSIIGNEATVLKIDQPQRGLASTTATSTANTRRATSFTAGTRGGDMRAPGGQTGAAGTASTDRTALLEQLKEMSTGEEIITIPVGIKMLKADTNNPKTMVEASIADITADKMITVWLNPAVTDKKVADFIMIN